VILSSDTCGHVISDTMSDSETQQFQDNSPDKLKAGAVTSDSEDESEVVNQVNGDTSESSSTDNSKEASDKIVANGADDTDSEEDEGLEKEEVAVANELSASSDSSEIKPKKATMDSVSSDTEDDVSEAAKDVSDGCVKTKFTPRYNDDDNDIDIDDMIADLPSEEPEESKTEAVEPEPVREATPEPVINAVEEVEEQPEDEEEDEVSVNNTKSPSPVQSPTPEQEDRSRSASPERKDSRGSHGSSSYDDERASSLSPEPPKVISAPSTKVMSPVTSPVSPRPTSQNKSPITKIYTDKIATDSDGEDCPAGKQTRQKPASDITQIYTQKLVQSDSPKPERAKFVRPSRDITQLYTAALSNKEQSPSRAYSDLPKRNGGDITKLYTGGLGGDNKAFKGKPNDERTNPTKHNMATSVDREAIREAYTEVMADNNGIEWATFIFKDNKLGVTAKGSQFNEFKSQFGPDDRGFGYIKVMTGDEMSKRSKFVMCTWVGPNVSVMKKAKMSTDKALMKDIIQNLSVELQCENANELTMDHFKAEVDKAGGARYGTGVRDK